METPVYDRDTLIDREGRVAVTDIVVSADHVSRNFGIGEAAITVIHDCSLDVHAGTILAIIGKSGSGKSTLCNLLSGLDRPSSGKIRLLGHDPAAIGDAKLAELRATRIGFVLQKDNLVPSLTIEENVAAPLIFGGMKIKRARERAREYLERVGLAHRATAWPSYVSGGEAQRAAVARACVTQPEIIFADEPTGALDSENGERVAELFRTMVTEHGAAGVLVTHDSDLAAIADETIHLTDGRITSGVEV